MEQATRIAASIETIISHLQNTQWWPGDIMRDHQLALLRPLLKHAYRTVPWYRRRFDDWALGPEAAARHDVWEQLPPLTRLDIQTAGDSLHSTHVPTAHGKVSSRWTSGSTASPVMVQITELPANFWIANSLRELEWKKCDVSGKLAVVRNVPPGYARPPDGAKPPTWGRATQERLKTGDCAVLDVRTTTQEQAEWLVRVSPDCLQTFPSVASALAQYCLEAKMQLRNLSLVMTFGETVDDSVRERCKQAWNADVSDSYSANEVGHVAAQCCQLGDYHIHSEHLLIEVVDDDERPCGPGEVGRVLVTDLFNYAMPLLRYEIGDYAEVGESCACGRRLPTLRRILGRQRNMFVQPDGRTKWPSWEADAVNAFEGNLPIRQFQVVQRSLSELEVKLVATRRLAVTEEAGVRGLMARWFCEGLHVRITYVDDIPRGPSGKFEDFRCEIRSED